VRDRDRVSGLAFGKRVEGMGIEEVPTAPRSPWQNPLAERVIGSVRSERLDHVIVLNERHLLSLLGDHFEHDHRWRCHRSLAMDCPEPRPVQAPEPGEVVEIDEAGGLYRHFERRAAA
jgi:transposase InsO family protein